jgi:hypothetical protein
LIIYHVILQKDVKCWHLFSAHNDTGGPAGVDKRITSVGCPTDLDIVSKDDKEAHITNVGCLTDVNIISKDDKEAHITNVGCLTDVDIVSAISADDKEVHITNVGCLADVDKHYNDTDSASAIFSDNNGEPYIIVNELTEVEKHCNDTDNVSVVFLHGSDQPYIIVNELVVVDNHHDVRQTESHLGENENSDFFSTNPDLPCFRKDSSFTFPYTSFNPIRQHTNTLVKVESEQEMYTDDDSRDADFNFEDEMKNCNISSSDDDSTVESSSGSPVIPELDKDVSLDQTTTDKDLSLHQNPTDKDVSLDQTATDEDVSLDQTATRPHSTAMDESVTLFAKHSVQEGCKQVYDKVNFCTFCKKGIKSKISRHLLTVHKDQTYNIAQLPKRSLDRMLELELLANEGNFKHNTNVLRTGRGQLVVARRNSCSFQETHEPTHYLPCEFCKRFILKLNLWQHNRSCSQRLNMSAEAGKQKNAVRRGRNLLCSALYDDDEKCLASLFSRMKDDGLKAVVSNDTLIRRYAALRVESLGSKKDQKLGDINRVSSGARTLARIVIEARKTKPAITLDTLIQPNNFDLVVASTRGLAFDEYKPSLNLGKVVGNLLGHVIMIKTGTALRNNDERRNHEAGNFKKLLDAEWNYRINAVAEKRLNTEKRQTVTTIPLTDDLVALQKFIVNGIKETAKDLKNLISPTAWTYLAKLVMCRLILFNKRRRAEVKDLKVEQYINRPNWKDDASGELQIALTPTDKMLAERYTNCVTSIESICNVYFLWQKKTFIYVFYHILKTHLWILMKDLYVYWTILTLSLPSATKVANVTLPQATKVAQTRSLPESIIVAVLVNVSEKKKKNFFPPNNSAVAARNSAAKELSGLGFYADSLWMNLRYAIDGCLYVCLYVCDKTTNATNIPFGTNVPLDNGNRSAKRRLKIPPFWLPAAILNFWRPIFENAITFEPFEISIPDRRRFAQDWIPLHPSCIWILPPLIFLPIKW